MDWSLVQAFLSVAEHGSLSAAARESGVSQPTLGRQIKAMEESLGVTLFVRQAKGLMLTEEGEDLLPAAQEMQEAASRLSVAAAGRDASLEGTVRITASVVTAQYNLPKIIAELRSVHPEIQIELNASDKADNLLFREADIAVRMFEPTQLEIVRKRLGVLRLGFFAAQSYLQRRGTPHTMEELMTHDVLGYDRSERFIRDAAVLGWNVKRSDFAFRCDQLQIHTEMVRAGVGIGVIQSEIGARMEGVVPVMAGFPVPGLEVWLSSHEQVRRNPRVKVVWSFLERGLTPLLSQNPNEPTLTRLRQS